METSNPGLEYPEKVEEEPEIVESKPNDQNKDEIPLQKFRLQYATRSKVLCANQTTQNHESTKVDRAKRIQCEICEASYKSTTSLNYHLQTKHPEYAKSMPTDKAIKHHSEEDGVLLQETKPAQKRLFQCNICNKVLSTKQNLLFHGETHIDRASRRRNYRCGICEVSFMTPGGLKYHLKTKHAKNRKKLPCPLCGRVFISVKGRMLHMNAEHGDDHALKCQKCAMAVLRVYEETANGKKGKKGSKYNKEGSRQRMSRRKVLDFFEEEKLPKEANMETMQEEDPVKSGAVCQDDEYAAVESSMSDVKYDAEEEGNNSTIVQVGNFEIQMIPDAELLEEADPDEAGENITNDEFKLTESNEINIKREIIELGEYRFADFDNDAQIDEIKVENVVVDSEGPESQIVEYGSKETPIPNKYTVKKMRKASTTFTRSCRYCWKKFKDWTRLFNHLQNRHGEIIDKSKLHRCTSCKVYFIST